MLLMKLYRGWDGTGAGIDERIRVTLTIEWLFLFFFGCLLVLGHIGLLLSHIYISKLFYY